MGKKLFIISPVVCLLLIGLVYQWIGTKVDQRRYPPLGEMVDIGGYALHLNCQGKQAPTVILDAGMGLNSLDWSLVQPKIAEFARVCSFDRAGYGWSDASPLVRTSQSIVEELHQALIRADIPPPYILVGHSFGGANMQLFASYYPEKVFGIVLVDSSSEGQIEEMTPPLPPSLSKAVFLANEGYYRFL
ncbi:MAG: alpha/beta hydrolase, partial [Chlamydiia bacterium]|nr:alpha/beta hydrolase [Chlamydiia bacterium]